ncbi:alpha-2-macroglobulin family protein [Verticiella sediminum]|uniref:Alpha-2-macroglobulin family protein n=1 Tax=Verticiella sediminum TaxID=1247510 RepID=A0A556AXJ6_9BURK|nr:alpha-2-macroglobulin [Verticiella sediminum]TSH97683.1 alpha-2-macroglobulin family protein [Verticiella sediminum]
MTKSNRTVWVGVFLGLLLLVAVAAVGWWMGARSADARAGAPAAPAATASVASASPGAATAPATPAPAEPAKADPASGAPALPASDTGTPDAFALLDCTARLYDNAQAIAVTFTQPLRAGQDLASLLKASDLGPVPDQTAQRRRGGAQDDAEQAAATPAKDAAAAQPIQGEWVLGENPRVAYLPYQQPNRRYQVAIGAQVAAADGATLPEAASCDLETPTMPPAYFFPSRGVVLPAGQNGGLPIVTVNVPEVDVQFLRIPPEKAPYFYETVLRVRGNEPEAAAETNGDDAEDDPWRWAGNRSLQGSVGIYDLDRLAPITQSVYTGRFVASTEKDRRSTTFLPVEDIAELQEPGIYVAVMSQPGRFNYESQVTYFYVSDLGVHAHRQADALDVYVTSLTSARAAEAVAVDLLDGDGKRIAGARTDAVGRAAFASLPGDARLVVARRGQEQTLLSLAQPALDLSEFAATGHAAGENRLFAYAGRDLYRPGETFAVSVLQRGPDGEPLPAAPITATLKRPDGRTVRTEVWQPHASAPGYVEHDIALPADAATGTWRLELRRDPGARQPDTVWSFSVEEFLPERMALDFTKAADELLVGQPLELQVRGRYLYGAPAAGNRLLGTLGVERARVPLPETLPGFIFGDVADDARRQWQELPEQETDAEGRASLEVPLELAGAQSPMRARVRLSLLESGGRPVIRTHDTLVWPAEALVGVRPLFDNDVTRQGSLAEFEVARARRDGTLAPGGEASVRLFHERREYYWRFDDQSGWNSGYTETDELVDSRTLDLAERTRLAVPVDWGRYRLEITDPENGRVLRYRFYAGWDAQDAENLGNRPDRVQLRLENAVGDGDTLRVHAVPPHDGEALVLVEGGGVRWNARMPIQAGGTTLAIPFDPAWERQDLYISVIAFRAGAQGEARVTPARAVGLLHVPLAREDRRLGVKIDAPARVRPETTQTVALSVDGAAPGDTVWATLSAVDVGILNITRYPTPDPFDFFFGQQRYGAQMLDMYGRLIEAMQGQRGRLKWGGDSGERLREPMPPKVRLVDLFSGPLQVGADGRVQVPLALPDFNGTLRLMAAAFTQDRYGSAEAQMVVAAPIVAELAAPRFLNDGDQTSIALDVANLSGNAQDVELALEAAAPLAIEEGARTLRLADGERRTLRFTARAQGVGDALLTLHVQGKGGSEPIRIERRATLGVAAATPARQSVHRGRLAPGESAQAEPGWFAGLAEAGLQVSVSADARPPVPVERLVHDLLTYPYGCTEQTISAAYPYLMIDAGQAGSLGMRDVSAEERERRVAAAIGRLAGMQAASGAFSLWGDGRQDVWLTAYVTAFLQDARRAGHALPAQMIERANGWLQARLREGPSRFPTLPERLARFDDQTSYRDADARLIADGHQRFAALAYAGYVLAREQQAPLASLRELYDGQAERARSVLPLIHLAAAFKLMGDAPRSRQALDAGMTRPYGMAGAAGSYWLGDYGSRVRDNALAYSLMTQHTLEHPRKEVLFVQATQTLGERSYLSTQEQLALILAWQAARVGATDDWRLALAVGGSEHTLARDGTATASLDGKAARTARLTNTGQAPLFYEVRSQGYMPAPVQPERRSAGVTAGWYHTDGRAWQGEPIASGQTLVVKLELQAEHDIETGLLVHRIPAGFELNNENLSPDDEIRNVDFGGTRMDAAADDSVASYREYRDDRYVAGVRVAAGSKPSVVLFYRLQATNPGTYTMPPALLEDMYRPEIRGIGRTGTVTVQRADGPGARR